jgi:hypothetical protein
MSSDSNPFLHIYSFSELLASIHLRMTPTGGGAARPAPGS